MSDIYYRNLSIALLMQTNEAIQDPSANPNDVVQLIVRAVSTARHSVEISPNYAMNWVTLGDVFREVAPL